MDFKRSPTADESYRPLPLRRQLLIVVLAVATAFTVLWMLLERPGAPHLKRLDREVCSKGQTADCVGGKADVIVLPPAAAASH
jgi:hypothetical protein